MIGPSTIPVVIDTDNALGSPRRFREKFLGGDVDDAYALAYLVQSRIQILEILSVNGNTSAAASRRNVEELLGVLKNDAIPNRALDNLNPILPPGPSQYLALGPLTNLAMFLDRGYKPERVVMTLGRISTSGDWPPYWPVEFNLNQDFSAFDKVIQNSVKKLIVPLDVAIDLKLKRAHRPQLQTSAVGGYLDKNSARWRMRNRLLKGRSSFPVWDLASAMAVARPATCRIERGVGHLFGNGLFLCDIGGEPRTKHDRKRALHSVEIEIVTAIDREAMFKEFFATLNSALSSALSVG